MPVSDNPFQEKDQPDIDLRNPYIAGFLAWLVPGLGHYYQKRYQKAVIFFLCIVPLFVAGCALASSSEAGWARNVYFKWYGNVQIRLWGGVEIPIPQMRLWWLVQAPPMGISAIPSGIQAWQVRNGINPPLFGRFMAPPQYHPGDRSGVAPTIDEIQRQMPHYELGLYFVVIAALMNVLVIFDAVGGPFVGRRKMEEGEG